MRLSLKLGAVCAAAALLPLIIASLVVLPQVSSYSRRRAIENLQGEARAASGLYEKRLTEMRSAAQRLANDIANRPLASNETTDINSPASWPRLQDMLSRAINEYGLDFAIIADPQGRVIVRHNDRPAPDETLLGAADKNPIAEKIVTSGNQVIATAVVERAERLAKLGLDRIAQVQVSNGSTVSDALMIEAAAPVIIGGRLVGFALLGQMLNTLYKPRPGGNSLQTPLVAEIRQTLYPDADQDRGALIAYGSAVVASSIAPASGSDPPLAGAARDTAQSVETIHQADRSYVIAWQPIKSLDNAELGAIGIAQSAGEIEGQKASMRAAFIAIGALAVALAGVGGYFYGRALAIRLDELAQAASRWSVGELSAPAKDQDPMVSKWIPSFIARDEITRLAAQLDEMRESFRQAIERLRKR